MSGQEVEKLKVGAQKQTTAKTAARIGLIQDPGTAIAAQSTVGGTINYGGSAMATISVGPIAADVTGTTVYWNGVLVFPTATNTSLSNIQVSFTDGATHMLMIILSYSNGSTVTYRETVVAVANQVRTFNAPQV